MEEEITGCRDAAPESPPAESCPSPDAPPPKARLSLRRRIGLILLLLVLVGSGIYVALFFLQKNDAADRYRELQQLYGTESGLPLMSPASPSPALLDYDAALEAGTSLKYGQKTESAALLRARNTLRSLQAINADIRAWISIADTGIDYPVLLGEDNATYLTRAYDGAYLNAGSLFFDYRCTGSLADRQNTVIYGHNMFSGLMFHDLKRFRDAEFFASHDIVIQTEDGIYTYRPFALYETTATDNYTQMTFSSEEEFLAFAAQAGEKSMHTTDIVIRAEDRLLTLSTCTNTEQGGRLALHAVLIAHET